MAPKLLCLNQHPLLAFSFEVVWITLNGLAHSLQELWHSSLGEIQLIKTRPRVYESFLLALAAQLISHVGIMPFGLS